MGYELNRLHLSLKEREKLLFESLKCMRFNDNGNAFMRKIYRNRRKKLSVRVRALYGDQALNEVIDLLRDNGFIKASESNGYFMITPRGKAALKRGFVETEPEKPYQKYVAWSGVVAIPIGLFSSEIRAGAKWIWQVLSDFLYRIF